MSIRKKLAAIVICFLIASFIVIFFGFKNPPKSLMGADLSGIEKVSSNQEKPIRFTDEEVLYWKALSFDLSIDSYPGETPDYVVKILTDKAEYTAMYNENSDIVFFSFIPEIKYGFLNAPPPGGWTKPIYQTGAERELLELLKISKPNNEQPPPIN